MKSQTILLTVAIAVIALAVNIAKCNMDNDAIAKLQSDNETLQAERDNLSQNAKNWEIIHDTLIQYRDRIKTKEKRIIEYIEVQDTSTINRMYDSLHLTRKACVVQAVELTSCREQLVVMDSVKKVDS